MTKTIKIILSILFFLCLLEMPYGYYIFVRFIAMIGFGYLAFEAYDKGENSQKILFIVLAVLFQPLLKIPLGRLLWNIVDVIVGIGLIGSLFLKNKE